MTVPITDHARLRYLERRYGLNIDSLDAEMQSVALDMAVSFGAPVVIAHGVKFVLGDNGAVVTVMPRRSLPRRPGKDR